MMARAQGDTLAAKDAGCWRVISIQAGGCMATTRRADWQEERQQVVLDYVTDNGADIVGIGDTRLGNDVNELNRMARLVARRAQQDSLREELGRISTGPRGGHERELARQRHRKATLTHWESAGSHVDENDIWRGGVAIGTYGDASLRRAEAVDDCRGWGRYQGRVVHGMAGKRLLVVTVYAPDSVYDVTDGARGDYSQRLGERAVKHVGAVSRDRWRPGRMAPTPSSETPKARLNMPLRGARSCK